jgi:pimeloyl-ACP methyl ester carboxylesterase
MVLVALATAACSTTPPTFATRQWPPWLRECAIDGAAGPARCGVVRVAESAAASAGRHIELRVVVLLALASPPASDPVLPLMGGPGQGAADLAALLAQRFATLRESRDLVLVDQRGTGQSNGLQCPPAPSAIELMGQIFDPARLVACRDELSSRADLTRYTTAVAAGDYEQVLDALGVAQVNVIGISYGSRMALELARRFPARIRTMTIEAVAPPTFDWPSRGASDAEAALDTLVGDCAADRPCAAAFPTLRDDIDAAFDRLRRTRTTAAVRDPVSGATVRVPFGVTDLAYATRGLLYGNEALSLPLLFQRAAQGDFDAFAQAYVTRARTLERQIARGVHLAVYCAEDLPFVDDAEAMKAAAGTRLGGYLIEQYRRACDVWPSASIPSSFRHPVTSAVPTLLMSGRRDPVTPPRTAEDATATLSRSRLVVWPHGGHGSDGLITGQCRTTIVQRFLSTADPEGLAIECMTHDPELSFRLPGAAR